MFYCPYQYSPCMYYGKILVTSKMIKSSNSFFECLNGKVLSYYISSVIFTYNIGN